MGKLTKTKRAEVAWDKTYRKIVAMEPFDLEKAYEILGRTFRVHGECPNIDVIYDSVFCMVKVMYIGNTNVSFRNELLEKVGKLMGPEYKRKLANVSPTRTWK